MFYRLRPGQSRHRLRKNLPFPAHPARLVLDHQAIVLLVIGEAVLGRAKAPLAKVPAGLVASCALAVGGQGPSSQGSEVVPSSSVLAAV